MMLARNRKFEDSPLEGTGFEISVPRGDKLRFWLAQGHRCAGSAATLGHLIEFVCACRAMGATAGAAARETFARGASPR